MRRLWPSLLRSSDLSPTRYDEKVFVKVKVMELKSKSHNLFWFQELIQAEVHYAQKFSKIQEWPLSPDNEEVAGARSSHGAAGEQTDGELMITLNIKTGPLELYRTERLDFIEHLSIFNIWLSWQMVKILAMWCDCYEHLDYLGHPYHLDYLD